MKFTLPWLKEHLDERRLVQAICDRLTMLGLEVEGVDRPAARSSGLQRRLCARGPPAS